MAEMSIKEILQNDLKNNYPEGTITLDEYAQGLQQALMDEEYDLDNVALSGTPKAEMVRKARITHIQDLRELRV